MGPRLPIDAAKSLGRAMYLDRSRQFASIMQRLDELERLGARVRAQVEDRQGASGTGEVHVKRGRGEAGKCGLSSGRASEKADVSDSNLALSRLLLLDTASPLLHSWQHD